jgi:hypothetical protein
VVFWAKTIRDEIKPHADPGEVPDVDLPAGAGASPVTVSSAGISARQDVRPADAEDEPDPELAAYNAYLARLNEQVRGHGRWHGLR